MVEERCGSDLLEDAFIGDHGRIQLVVELVEDDAFEGWCFGDDGVCGEQGVVDGTKFVASDEEDGEVQVFGEVGEIIIFGDRDFPTAGAFDDDDFMLGGEAVVGLDEVLRVDGAVFQDASHVGGDGSLEEEGIDEFERQVTGGGRDGHGVVAVATSDGFEADGIDASGAE